MPGIERTNYLYVFTYNSAPGTKEIFQCKYVLPDEALKRFRKMLALAPSPFDFRIDVSDESIGEESSFQVKGSSIEEMFEKFRVFLEASTGYSFAASDIEVKEQEFEATEYESMSNYEKMQMIIYASFKHGKFSSLDVTEIYRDTFEEDLPKSTASTYLARMWNNAKGHLERLGNRSGYTYRLKTEIDDVQKEIDRAETILGSMQVRVGK
ncbi:MAG: hypothetical protein ACFFDM_00345 [Candidatus Thorarchaeota archaeon]